MRINILFHHKKKRLKSKFSNLLLEEVYLSTQCTQLTCFVEWVRQSRDKRGSADKHSTQYRYSSRSPDLFMFYPKVPDKQSLLVTRVQFSSVESLLCYCTLVSTWSLDYSSFSDLPALSYLQYIKHPSFSQNLNNIFDLQRTPVFICQFCIVSLLYLFNLFWFLY